MNNKCTLFVLDPIQSNESYGVFITNLQCLFTEDTELFMRYPLLQYISNMANDILTTIFKYFAQNNLKGLLLSSFEKISTDTNSFLKISYLESIKMSIKSLNDVNLKVFFFSVYIKFICIYLCKYFSEYSTPDNVNKDLFKTIKSFVLDLYASIPSELPIKLDRIVKESLISTISAFGNYIFLPESNEELINLINKIFSNDNQKMYFIKFMFTGPSSFCYFNQFTYEILKKMNLDMTNLFMKNIHYFILFVNKDDRENSICYLNALFDNLKYILTNDSESSNSLSIAMKFLSHLFYYDFSNLSFSLELEKRIVELSRILYNRIKKIQEVYENDKEFANLDLTKFQKKVYEEKKTLAINISNIKSEYIINFDAKVNKIRVRFSANSRINKDDNIKFISDKETKYVRFTEGVINPTKWTCMHSNSIKIRIRRKWPGITNWKMKIYIVGSYDYDSDIWLPNEYLFFYNYYLYFLFKLNSSVYNSTPIENVEKEFNFILNNEIIQGIKIEEIDQYEKELLTQCNDKIAIRKISRGISRGIGYNSEDFNDDDYDINTKKNFINKIISINKDSIYESFFSFVFNKVKPSNIARLNQVSEKIVEVENYFIACLLKQLGLISTCLKNIAIFQLEKQNFKIPNQILLVFKNVLSLRKELLFKKQKTRIGTDTSIFDKYVEEVKRKCILFLYSDSILYLKYRNNLNNEKIDSAAKSIFSFIISEIPIEKVSDLIDIRRKRLNITNESLSLISSLIDQNLLFESSKSVFANYCKFEPLLYKLKGLTKVELEEYYKSFSNLSVKIIENIFYNNPDFIAFNNSSSLLLPLFEHDNYESKIKCSKLLIDLLEKNKNSNSLYKNQISLYIILILFAIASQTKSIDIIDYNISLLWDDSFEFNSKYLVLYYIPYYIALIPDNEKVFDENLAFSLLSKNKSIPVIIKSLIEWITYIFIAKNDFDNKQNHHEFILKVLKGIGNSFVGKSCLFIDDSFQPFTHRQVSESMISFIRLLFNSKNEILESIFHDILTNRIKNINFMKDNEDDLIISIGLFASIGSEISAFIAGRRLVKNDNNEKVLVNLISDIAYFRDSVPNTKFLSFVYTNAIFIDPSKFDLNQNEIENILQLHDVIIHSNYLNNEDYERMINHEEIMKSMLIATFYSFLPIIMQNKNNVSILLNDDNLKKSMSLFDFSRTELKSNENLIIFLSNYLEKAISSSLYNSSSSSLNNVVDLNGSFRFVKLNWGRIYYANEIGMKDTIISDPNELNIFMCNRIFSGNRNTYFEIKIKSTESLNIFIGFVDSKSHNLNDAYGFGSFNNQKVFCRRSNYLAMDIYSIGDKIMEKENPIEIKNEDSIGCYYTSDYIYLTKNGQLTPYRLYHKSLNNYIPFIAVDHENVQLEININVTIINNSVIDKLKIFDFYEIPKLNRIFEPNDFNSIERICKDDKIKNKLFNIIGSSFNIKELVDDEYKYNPAIIKDTTDEKGKFVIEAYNSKKLSNEIIEIKFDEPKDNHIEFFNIIENITNTKFSYNSSLDMNCLPDNLQIEPDLNKIKSYLKNKTIKENSSSIAIIMTRYLVFILVDYLRYSKSKLLLQEEGIKTIEMQNIIKSLAYSLPTITSFSTILSNNISKNYKNYLIFNSNKQELNQENRCKLPGLYVYFSSSVKAFLKQTEKVISPHFYIDLLNELFDVSSLHNSPFSCDSLYRSCQSSNRYESVFPLPSTFNVTQIGFKKLKSCQECNILGIVPILINSIPNQLPCVACLKKKLRLSSDSISYLRHFDPSKTNVIIKWEYKDINNEPIKDYQLKLCLFHLSTKLNQTLLDGQLGFLQILILFFNTFNPSDNLMKNFLNHNILDKLYILSTDKNPLLYPFIKPMILILNSVYNFSEVYLTKKTEKVISILSYPNNNLYPLKSYPNYQNESYFIFSIYSNLIKARNAETMLERSEIDLSDLFEIYYLINSKLFSNNNEIDNVNEEGKYVNIDDEPSVINYIFKDYHFYYLLYYYSILCNNNNSNMPYPMFLFVHERIRQHFGGFKFEQGFVVHPSIRINIKNEYYEFKSGIINNDFDLECSFKYVNYNTNSQTYSKMLTCPYKVYVHQFMDDKIIEIHQIVDNDVSVSVTVTFPLEILIKISEQRDNEGLCINFLPSKKQQKEYFISHYDEILREFQYFISIKPSFSNEFDSKEKTFKMRQIPKNPNSNSNGNIELLSESILSSYLNLFVLVNSRYHSKGSNAMIQSFYWNIPLIRHNDKLKLYIEPITFPLNLMDTKSKLKIIKMIIDADTNETNRTLQLRFNRFEAQEFKDSFDHNRSNGNENKSLNKNADPLFIQLMNQVRIKSIPKMKKSRLNPFMVTLVNEQAVDVGGPGREIFSNLIVEMMNDHLGIFTMNPNMRNQIGDTNREDLIPNKMMRNDIYQYKDDTKFSERFNYAGALIAICIKSNLPQQMNLAPFIWEYLLNSSVSIESIYEIDNEFKNFIKNLENLLQKVNDSKIDDDDDDDVIDSSLLGSFEITDSFGSLVELVPSGSNKNVNEENLCDFIELAKEFRIHEFDEELKALKDGFNMIIKNSSFLRILDYKELKLLTCGEIECKISRMKELIIIEDNGDPNLTDAKKEIFWNVMESFSVHERLLFIRFSSGYMGLPTEGLNWVRKLKVIFSREQSSASNFDLPRSHTCFLTVNIPFFQTEEDLAYMLRIAINSCECYGNA